ncbi:hypothetical protein F1734_09060 [Rhodococcus ruber]|uniref:Swt1 family HEPN domain-containing protein n=1 Tax=Rhodococcus ruber TaxID=1830 RepID=UPI0019345564|nr:Swt1 family HEPN domain-containing protein [Rhodococcus ruber]QRE80380.1 hypothetical protein F1734_09060 [Rhodococcus ruber]
MATLEPEVALTTCENALRELMAHAYSEAYGTEWLQKVTTEKQRAGWPNRKSEETLRRKGAAAIPNEGLAYTNFYDLIDIAEQHWEPLSRALGKRQSTHNLLKRFGDLRNTVAHGRPLLAFEQDLISGIAGQIRNQVTIYMSNKDQAGDYYPRIDSAIDSFGHEIDCSKVDLISGRAYTEIGVRPGDIITFRMTGVDPQDRLLHWSQNFQLETLDSVITKAGEVATLTWNVIESHVGELANVEIRMKSVNGKFHRYSDIDHAVNFIYAVRPPL